MVYKVLLGGHYLRYPLPYPLPGFFLTTLPEPYPKSKSPTRHSLHRIRTDFRNVETGFVDGIILSHPNS